jgi:hypothetical protein
MASDKEKANCKKKTRYTSDASAQNAIKKINSSKLLGKPRRAYKCPVCSGWHLSSKQKI